MDELIDSSTSEKLVPVRLVGIGRNINKNTTEIKLEILDCVSRCFIAERIQRTDLSPRSLKTLIERCGGICPEPRILHKKLEAAVNKLLVENVLSNDNCIEIQHNCLGWSEYQGEQAFFCSLIIMQSHTVMSTYVGDYDVRPNGSFDKVKELLTSTLKGNVPMLAIACLSVSATVLPYANLRWDVSITNTINHLVGTSSEGKSTATNLFVSFGSKPAGGGSFKLSFASTLNALMKKVELNMGYPCAIDESSAKGRKTNWTEFVYTAANQQSKERCLAGGSKVSRQHQFMTVFLTNGEKGIINRCSGADGIRARVFEYEVDSWTRSAEESAEINAVCKNNFGFITPLVAQKLFEDDEKFQVRFYGWVERIKLRVKEERLIIHLGDRLADILALYMTSSEILEEIVEDEIDISAIYDFFFEQILVKCASEENVCERAYNILINYYAEHRDLYNLASPDINVLDRDDAYILPEGQEGLIDGVSPVHIAKGVRYPHFIAFKPDVLFNVLEDRVPDVTVALREMRKEGLLRVKDKDRLRYKIMVNGQELGFYCIWADLFYYMP